MRRKGGGGEKPVTQLVSSDSHLLTMVDRHMYPVRVIQETAQLITGVCVCVCRCEEGGRVGEKASIGFGAHY